jgi:hypothetical protein
VLLADDLRQGIPQSIQETLVGGEHRAVHREFDHGERIADGCRERFQFPKPSFGLVVEARCAWLLRCKGRF